MNRDELKKRHEIETYIKLFFVFSVVSALLWYVPLSSEPNFFQKEIWDDDSGDKWKCVYCGCLNGSGSNFRPRTCCCCGKKQ